MGRQRLGLTCHLSHKQPSETVRNDLLNSFDRKRQSGLQCIMLYDELVTVPAAAAAAAVADAIRCVAWLIELGALFICSAGAHHI